MKTKIKILVALKTTFSGFIIKDNLEEAGFDVINCPGRGSGLGAIPENESGYFIAGCEHTVPGWFQLAENPAEKSDIVP